MTTETAIFTCSICGERSTEICVYCTKDACGNHRCERCKRCSDCCECEMPLSEAEHETAEPEVSAAPQPPAPAEHTLFAPELEQTEDPAQSQPAYPADHIPGEEITDH